ncbi:MAG: hypothetical protein ACLFRX_00410 [Gemmatimonadota bacterium]
MIGRPRHEVVHRLSWATTVLVGFAVAAGVLQREIYRDNDLVAATWLGNDLVTLAVAVPLLALATRRSARGSIRWRLVLLGLLLYAFYGYAFYLFGAAFNALFLVYVAIMVTSGGGLLLGLGGLDVSAAASGFRDAVPARAVAAFMLAVGVLLGGFWVALSVAYLFTGAPPPMVEATAHPTNVTGALDLSIVVTLGLLGGVWLWRRRPWGYVLAVIWTVKGAVYMLALSAAAVAAWRYGPAADIAQVALWAPIGVGSAASALALLVGYRESGARGVEDRAA